MLNVDSESTTFLRDYPVQRERGKHIDTMYHYINDCMEEGKTEVNYSCTDDQLTNILTKALNREKLLEIQRRIGIDAVL